MEEFLKQDFVQQLVPLATQYGIKVIGVIVLLIVGMILARWAARAVRRSLEKARVDVTLTRFLARMTRWTILLFVVLGCISVFGVSVASFAAVVAASAFAVGLAFQGSLSNFAAGIMLLVFRPFDVGDVVSAAGTTGKVDEIGLFTTTFDTPDNRRLIVPNGSIFGATIENVSHHPVRRVDVAVGTDYGADLDRTRDVLMGAAQAIPDQVPDREAQVVLGGLGDSAIEWTVRVWVDASNFWPTKEALTRAVKKALDGAEIGIPYPQMDVHVDQAAA